MSTGLFVEQATAKYMDIRKNIGQNRHMGGDVVESKVKQAIQRAIDSKNHIFILPFTSESDSFWQTVQAKNMNVLKLAYDLVEENKDEMLKVLSGIASSECRDLAIFIAVVRNEDGKNLNDYLEEAKELIAKWNEDIISEMASYFGLIRKMGDSFLLRMLNQDIEKKCETVLNDKFIKMLDEERQERLKKTMERFPEIAFEKNLADLMNTAAHCDSMIKSFAEEVNMEPPVYFSMDYMKEDFLSRVD